MTEKETTEKEFSFLQPEAMGGLHGGEGYTYQDRYIACHIPVWLANPEFVRFMAEASGDVDVVFHSNEKDYYEHIQVKDHLVAMSEFRQVIESFSRINNGTGKTYRKFTLTCPTYSREVKSFCAHLKRFRNVRDFIDKENKSVLTTTEEHLKKDFKKLQLEGYYEFILEKVYLENCSVDFSNDSICEKMFSSHLAVHPSYQKLLQSILNLAYIRILREVIANRGKGLLAKDMQSLIESVIAGVKAEVENHVLHIHNWAVEKYEPQSTVTIDWSNYFDRQNKTIPDVDIWNYQLVPELYKLKENLSKNSSNRHIIFRGRCTLSTGIALGMAFPEIGSWTFELLQPPQPNAWRSDAQRINDYNLIYREINCSTLGIKSGSDEIAVVFNITGAAVDDVAEYFKIASTPLKKMVSIEPANTPGGLSIKNDIEAVSLASASKDIIKKMLTKHKAKKVHLFFFGPIGLAIFLGQKLTSLGSIQLYEFSSPGYKPSCLLKS